MFDSGLLAIITKLMSFSTKLVMFASLAAGAFSTVTKNFQQEKPLEFDQSGVDVARISPVSENVQEIAK